MHTRIAALLVAASMGMASTASAENWPQFRGPTGQGVSSATGLPVRWSPTENVRWKAELPGNGWSSPIVWQDRIYLTAAVPLAAGENPNHSLRALCLDAATGREIWNVEVFQHNAAESEGIHSKNSHASPTPITDGRRLFVHFGTQGTACLNLDGEIEWATRELKYGPTHGSGSSPVLVDDLVVVGCDGWDVQYLVALDQSDGSIRWKSPRPTIDDPKLFSFCTPLVISVDGTQQIVSPASHGVLAYNPANGEEIWRVGYNGYSVVPRPVYAHGLVYVCTGFGSGTTLLAIRPTGRGDVTESHVEWRHGRAVPTTPSLLVVGDELYASSDQGIATCLDAKTGDPHWTQRLGGNYSASPIHADGKIYFQSEEAETTVIAAETEFRELGKNRLEGRALASFAIAGSDLLIRTDAYLYRIESAAQ